MPVKSITLTLWNYLSSLDLFHFFVVLFNQVVPFGIFFWGAGLVLFIVIHMKTENLAYSGAILALYMIVLPQTGMITNIYSALAMRYTGILLGFIFAYYIFKAIRG